MTESEQVRIKNALDEMLKAECGDVNDVPAAPEPTESATEPPKSGPRYKTRSKDKATASATDDSDAPPRFLRVVMVGPVATGKQFQRAAQAEHKYPLFVVRNERMTEYFGDEWWVHPSQFRATMPPLVDDKDFDRKVWLQKTD